MGIMKVEIDQIVAADLSLFGARIDSSAPSSRGG